MTGTGTTLPGLEQAPAQAIGMRRTRPHVPSNALWEP